MEAPLALHGDAEAEQPSEPQPLPRELRENLRRHMVLGTVGPLAPATRQAQRRRAQTMASIAAGNCCLAALVFFNAMPPEAPLARATFAVAIGAMATVLAAGANSYTLWRDVLPGVLEQLEAPVGAKAAAELRNRLRSANAFLTLLLGVVFPMCVAVAYEAIQVNPDLYLWLVAVAFAVLAVPMFVNVAAAMLITSVAFVLAEDSVERLASETRRTTAASADFDALTDGVYQAHVATAELSQLLEPNVLSFTVLMFVNVAEWLIVSVAPRPAYSDCGWSDCDLMNDLWGAGHWYNFFFNPYLMAVLAVVASGLTIYTLFAPARVTSACQRVAEAVNDLRVTAKDGEPAKLATPEQLHRIEGLKRYINELNRDQGLGILFLRKRITYTLVMGMLIQTVSAMVVINTTLMSILHAEKDEEAAIVGEETAIEEALGKG